MKFRAPLTVAQTTANGVGSLVAAFLNRDQIARQAEMQAAPSFADVAAKQAAAEASRAQALKYGQEAQGLQIKNDLQRNRSTNAVQAALDAAGAVGPARQALPVYRDTGAWGAPVENPALAGPPEDGFSAPRSPAQAPAGVNDQMLRAFMSTLAAAGLSSVDGGNSTADNLANAAQTIGSTGLRDAVLNGQVPASLVGTAQAALKGSPLYAGHEFGAVDNFTGTINDASPVAQRFAAFRQSGTDDNVAQAGAARANAAQSLAAAGVSRAQVLNLAAETRKTEQEIEQGYKTGDIQVVTGEDGSVQLVNKRTALSRPAVGLDGKPVQGGGKPLNEGQAKANLFGARMAEADKALAELEGSGTTRPGTIKGIAEGAGRVIGLGTDTFGGTLADIAGSATNWTQSPAQQKVEQARRDFINAVLRRESGAAIASSEFANADKQYFPQPGDSPAVIAQKQRNRKLAIQGLAAEVPAGKALPSLAEAARGATAAPTTQRNVTVTY